MEKQIVYTPSLFSVDKDFDDSRFMRVRVAAMHSGINRNKSRFSLECIEAAKDTFANIPILADVREYTDENGNTVLDYAGHSMHIEDDKFNDGEQKMIYDEKVVGVVPETNNFEIVHDDETGNDYVYVDALLYRDYGNYCCDILENRGGNTDVSMEIACDDISYSAKDKVMDVGIMTACACTLLGASVTPGMEKAHAEVFSSTEDNRQNQLIQIMQELKESLDNYIELKKGGTTVNNEILEEVTETLEEQVTETEEFIADEVAPVEGNFSEEDAEVTPEFEVKDEVLEKNFAVNYTVKLGEQTREFSVSLNDKIYALQQLINDTYEADGDWYSVEVFEDIKQVQFYGWFKSYRQTYKVKGDNYSLVGDRVEIHSVWMTDDEEAAFEKMKADFAELQPKFEEVSAKLANYEAEPAKMKILNSEEYAQIAESEEFVALKAQDAHFEMSVDEVQAKADEMLLAYAKSGKLEFAAQPEVGVKNMPLPSNKKTTKKSRYGNLFNKED